MNYTARQIETAKRNYNAFLKFETLSDYDVATIGENTATQRMDFNNRVVSAINNGDKELEKEWKLFFLIQEVKLDQKDAESKAKKSSNKSASAEVLEPIKAMKKLGDFGKWLNTSGNEFRKQHFNKKYTDKAVNAFLATI